MGSWRIGTVRGIDIKLHWSFPLILIWAAFNWGFAFDEGWRGAVFGMGVTLLLFACVALHELGHSLVAVQLGSSVRDITLLPIGGVARMERMPEKPWQELLVAIAGPVVNVLIALGLLPVLWLLASTQGLTLRGLVFSLGTISLTGLLTYLFAANVMLVLFNLIPAFPLDGGRVFRAVLAMIFGQQPATRVAVIVGRLAAVGLGLLGLYLFNPFIILTALFIFGAAGAEAAALRRPQPPMAQPAGATPLIRGDSAGRFVQLGQPVLTPNQTLGSAVELAFRYPETTLAVVDGGRVVGLVTRQDLLAALQEYHPLTGVWSIMKREGFFEADAGTSLLDLYQRLLATGTAAVAITDQGRFLGLLTLDRVQTIQRWLTGGPQQTISA